MKQYIINNYKANEENYMFGIFTEEELQKAYVECIELGDGYVFCYSKAIEDNGSTFHYVSCWKKNKDNDYELICRSKHALNTMDLSSQFFWMKDVAKRHAAA